MVKKRFLSLLLCAFMLFAFTGCKEEVISAYDVAVKNGYTGTEEEWLASLRGTDGSNASQYDIFELYAVFKSEYPDKTFDDFIDSLGIEYGAEYASNKALRSAVSVYCDFTVKTSSKPFSSGTKTVQSGGAGVIYKLDKTTGLAHIITNYHVVYHSSAIETNQISQAIRVYTYGREIKDNDLTATYLGGSMDGDIAVLTVTDDRFKDDFFTAVDLGDSDNLTVGERALAVGNPEGSGISVTQGILSTDSEVISMQKLNNSSDYVDTRVMRTDAAINSGNSGGGLYNISGQLIGIVNARAEAAANESDIQNIGFAIPVNYAVGVADNIIATQKPTGASYVLGMQTDIMSISTVYDGKAVVIEEVYVTTVPAGTYASGKINNNDIILSVTVGGKTKIITRHHQIDELMLYARQGDTVSVKVRRSGSEMTVPINIDNHIAAVGL